jgi:hypothetical protein
VHGAGLLGAKDGLLQAAALHCRPRPQGGLPVQWFVLGDLAQLGLYRSRRLSGGSLKHDTPTKTNEQILRS